MSGSISVMARRCWLPQTIVFSVLIATAAVLLPAHVAVPAVHAAANCDVDSNKLTMDSEEQAAFNGINAYRASMGAPALTFSTALMRIALWKSTDMATHGYFDHTDQSLGRDVHQRFADCGYDITASTGEDLAACEPGGITALTQWQNQPEHNLSILDRNFLFAGIKRVQGAPLPGIEGPCWYWTLGLGSIAGGDATGGGAAPPAAALAAPQVTAVALDSQTIRLQWTAVLGAAGYQAYDGTNQRHLDPVAGDVTSLTVSGLSPGGYYCFVLYAYSAISTSGWSGWACATAPSG